jgi:hypothetical protein
MTQSQLESWLLVFVTPASQSQTPTIGGHSPLGITQRLCIHAQAIPTLASFLTHSFLPTWFVQ